MRNYFWRTARSYRLYIFHPWREHVGSQLKQNHSYVFPSAYTAWYNLREAMLILIPLIIEYLYPKPTSLHSYLYSLAPVSGLHFPLRSKHSQKYPVFHFHIFFLSVVCCWDLYHPRGQKRERLRKSVGQSWKFWHLSLFCQKNAWAGSTQASFLIMDTIGSYLAHSV